MEQGSVLGVDRDATAYDQEGIITLLPDHYAEYFVEQGQVRRICTDQFHYNCEYSAIVRHAPKPSRAVSTFLCELIRAHNMGA